MTLNDKIMLDPPANRRIRRLAPLVILIAFAALAIAPGLIAEHHHAAAGSGALSGLAGFPMLLVAGLRRVG